MKKLTVKSFLNVRVGEPSVNATCYQYLAPGSVIDVEDRIYKGSLFEGSDDWYKDGAGNYYWAGGFEKIEQNENTINPIIDYKKLLNISDTFKKETGEDIIIAIIDTGCFKHPALRKNFLKVYDVFDKNDSKYIDDSIIGHGTFIAGIIAANPTEDSPILGIAPKAKLIITRVAKQKNEFSSDNVVAALNWLLQQDKKPDIINMSFNVEPTKQLMDTLALFKDTLIVAAGIDDINPNSDNVYYPAMYPPVLPVAALKQSDVGMINYLSHKIKYVIPNVTYTSLDNSYATTPKTGDGSSFATAVISGTMALYLSYFKKNNIKGDFLDFFNEHFNQIQQNNFSHQLNIYKNEKTNPNNPQNHMA